MQLGSQTFTISRESASASTWVDVCGAADVLPGTGVAARVHGVQVAIVRTRDDEFFAVSNFDPFGKANVIARGIVGDRNGVPKIASPLFKQSFDLRTGICLDDPSVRLAVYPVRLAGGRVLVGEAEQPR